THGDDVIATLPGCLAESYHPLVDQGEVALRGAVYGRPGFGAWRSGNWLTSVWSTPVKVPVGAAASSDDCRRGDGDELCAHLAASSCGGCRQHPGSGQVDTLRLAVSRPRNHLTWANGVPRLTENAPCGVNWMLEVHQ